MTDIPDWAIDVPSAPGIHSWPEGAGSDLVRPFSVGQLIEFGLELMEQFLRRVVQAVMGFFPGGAAAFDLLSEWADKLFERLGAIASILGFNSIDDLLGLLNPINIWRNIVEVFIDPLGFFAKLIDIISALTGLALGDLNDLAAWAAGLPLIGDIVRAITGIFGGEGDLSLWFTNLRSFLAGINFLDPNFSLANAATAFINLILSPVNLLAELVNGFIPGGLIPGLDGSKITSGVVDLIRLPSNLLTTASTIAASAITGVLDAARIPGLAISKVVGLGSELAGKAAVSAVNAVQSAVNSVQSFVNSLINAILEAIRGIPVVGGTLADIISSIGRLNTTANTAHSQAGAAAVAASSIVAQLNQGIFGAFGATNPTMETTLPVSALGRPVVEVGNHPPQSVTGSTASASGVTTHSHGAGSLSVPGISHAVSSGFAADPWHFEVTPTRSAGGFVICQKSTDKKVVEFFQEGSAPTSAVMHVWRMDPESGATSFLETINIGPMLRSSWGRVQVEISETSVEPGDVLSAEICVSGGSMRIAGMTLPWMDDDESARPKRLGWSRSVNAGATPPATIPDGGVDYVERIPYIGFGQLVGDLPVLPRSYVEPWATLDNWDVIGGNANSGGAYNSSLSFPLTRNISVTPRAFVFKHQTATDKVQAHFTLPIFGYWRLDQPVLFGIGADSSLDQYVAVEVTRSAVGQFRFRLVTGTSPHGPLTVRDPGDTWHTLSEIWIEYDPETLTYTAQLGNNFDPAFATLTWADTGGIIKKGSGFRHAMIAHRFDGIINRDDDITPVLCTHMAYADI